MSECLKQRAKKIPLCIFAGCFVAGLVCVGYFFRESQKSKTYITRQCRVEAIDVEYKKREYYPYWTVKIVDGDQCTPAFLITTRFGSRKSYAWERAEKYQINETYPCYGPEKNEEYTILSWDWQWENPFISKNYEVLISGIVLLIISVAVFIWVVFFKPKCLNTRPHQDEERQTETPLRPEQNHESTV